jgi:uncharacterized protein
MLVIYHANCHDGFCCAWLLWRHGVVNPEGLVPAQYGDEPPWDKMSERESVMVCDFSYPRDVLERVRAKCKSLVVLDHHKTAQENLRGLDYCTFDVEKSGGRLTWEWLVKHECCGVCPERPWLVDYTEDRDLWRHGLTDTREVHAALSSYSLELSTWESLHVRGWRALVPEGRALLRYRAQVVAEHVKRAREIEMSGRGGSHKVLAVNATTLYSEVAGALAEGRPFGACYFDRAGTDGRVVRQWSLRSTSDGVDVSEIARARGGGGHEHAAGFEETL